MAVHYRLSLKLDAAGATKDAQAVAYREVISVTRRVFNRANVLTPVDTGNLRAHNQMRTNRGRLTGEIWNDTTYAPAVHDGSKAVTIRPRSKRALRFKVDGKVVFATRVTLPARRGRPWLYRALKEVAAQTGYQFTPGR